MTVKFMGWIVLVLLLTVAGSVTAQDVDSENECDVGGLLDGVCLTDADWACGFEFAQFRKGTRLTLPDRCFALSERLGGVVGSNLDNACNYGGTLWREDPASSCPTSWHVGCGWYLARWEIRGGFNAWDGSAWTNSKFPMPDHCAGVLPQQLGEPPENGPYLVEGQGRPLLCPTMGTLADQGMPSSPISYGRIDGVLAFGDLRNTVAWNSFPGAGGSLSGDSFHITNSSGWEYICTIP